ncbi:MAG: D-fructose 1,6-bisphosphatase [Candidatus Bathyarchaeota archaeon]|jgi:myo-inositol-1(or 4)-monophosphatase|nr:D-fructose 1,6-bisphosphatase [Candidatus Bathyarchaeota archaeon]MDI9577682.1 inositol monophosphatase family protein [Thermoproteota archaeon]NLD66710.1 D-fructose 1,6-bisphosphatase [Thermoproteota archaeon]
MKTPEDWQQILNDCKRTIQDEISPCLRTLNEPQVNLGVGAGGDVTKPVDLAAETAIVATLKKHGVSFTLISEESGFKEFGDSPKTCFVTVDPVDGTTNLLHGLPFYAASIAISSKPELEAVYAGMVADLVHDLTYFAFKDQGAYKNGVKIETSKTVSLDEALVGLDMNAYQGKVIVSTVAGLIENTRHIRHFGANALEICYVADGSTDAFIDLRGKIRTTDVAAGFLIVKEAGGIVTDVDDKEINVPLHPKQTLNFIASSNGVIHKEILSLVKT